MHQNTIFRHLLVVRIAHWQMVETEVIPLPEGQKQMWGFPDEEVIIINIRVSGELARPACHEKISR